MTTFWIVLVIVLVALALLPKIVEGSLVLWFLLVLAWENLKYTIWKNNRPGL